MSVNVVKKTTTKTITYDFCQITVVLVEDNNILYTIIPVM